MVVCTDLHIQARKEYWPFVIFEAHAQLMRKKEIRFDATRLVIRIPKDHAGQQHAIAWKHLSDFHRFRRRIHKRVALTTYVHAIA